MCKIPRHYRQPKNQESIRDYADAHRAIDSKFLKFQKMLASELNMLDESKRYCLSLLLKSHDSIRSKYIEELLTHALTPMNFTGEGDVNDIWIGFRDLNVNLDGSKFQLDKYEKYKESFFCSTIENGFGIEVKCTRTRSFDVESKKGFAIPLSNTEKSFDVNKKRRWSDFYILIKLKEPEDSFDSSLGAIDILSSLNYPEEDVEEIFIVPTYMFCKKSNPTKLKVRGHKNPVSLGEVITKAGEINVNKLRSFTAPISDVDFSSPEAINKLVRDKIFFLLEQHASKISKYRVDLDDLKRTTLKK